MSIYDMLDTIAEDTKARYITRIVDTGMRNAGPKLNIYFLVNASGKEIISEVSLNQQLGLLFND